MGQAVARAGMAKSEIVAQTLEREIREGRVSHGDLLDSEGALMQRFAVSRNTVRRGLEMLARQGLITTRTGIGSFVTYDGTTIDSNLGWSVALSRAAGQIETRVLDLRRGGCAKADGFLGGRGDFLCLDRLRHSHATGFGISLERSRLPWREVFAPVLDSGLTGGSLSRTLADLGLVAQGGQELAGVIRALSPVDAAVMGRPAGQPMLRLQRVTRIEDGSVLEYVESILDPDHFGLRVEF
jgi:GntR family transcriptional regulator